MPVSAQDAARSVFRAVEAYNASEKAHVSVSTDAVLLGAGSAVDSLGLVRLILTVERQVEDDLGTAISLTDEKALSLRTSPFRTVGTLVDYIVACLNEPR